MMDGDAKVDEDADAEAKTEIEGLVGVDGPMSVLSKFVK